MPKVGIELSYFKSTTLRLFGKAVLLLGVLPLVAACDKSENAPVPLDQILPGSYWHETVHFLYSENGEQKISQKDILLDPSCNAGRPDGSLGYADQVLLEDVYVDPQSNNLRRFYLGKKDNIPYAYFKGHENLQYTISWDEQRGVVRVDTQNEFNAMMNAVAGSEMQVVSATSDRIVFTAPIKEYIYKRWHLSTFDGRQANLPKRDFTGLYIVWEKIAKTDKFVNAEAI